MNDVDAMKTIGKFILSLAGLAVVLAFLSTWIV